MSEVYVDPITLQEKMIGSEKDCPAWSGKDCTRHPYEEGCLKDGVSD